MRKTLLFASLALLLAACGGSSNVACDATYDEDGISTCLPADWHVVTRDELDERGIPAEVVVGFQSDKPVSGQFATVTVTREVLPQDLTSPEYSDASMASVEALPGYTEVDRRAVKIDDQNVDIHIFTAQPRDDQPESRFYQLSAVAGNDGYTFTAATPVAVNSDLETQILLILKSVSLKAQTSSAGSSEDSSAQ